MAYLGVLEPDIIMAWVALFNKSNPPVPVFDELLLLVLLWALSAPSLFAMLCLSPASPCC